MDSWKDKVVIITVGGAGIARATALLFAEGGARVVIMGRRSEPLERLGQDRGNMNFVVADAAQPDDASRTIATTIERWGRLDVKMVDLVGIEPTTSSMPWERKGSRRLVF